MSEIRCIEHNSSEYDLLVQLRYEVLRAPLGLQFSRDFLLKDQYDIMFAYFFEDNIYGCCQLTEKGNGIFQLRQMAVSPKMQGKHIGRQLVANAEQYVLKHKGKKISLHARQIAMGFYEKLGYYVVGEQFEEVGIPHYTMEKSLVSI